jgi:hypothetical protein
LALRTGETAGAKGLGSKALARGSPCPVVNGSCIPGSISECAGVPSSSAYARGTIPGSSGNAGGAGANTGRILTAGDRGRSTSEPSRWRAGGRG